MVRSSPDVVWFTTIFFTREYGKTVNRHFLREARYVCIRFVCSNYLHLLCSCVLNLEKDLIALLDARYVVTVL